MANEAVVTAADGMVTAMTTLAEASDDMEDKVDIMAAAAAATRARH